MIEEKEESAFIAAWQKWERSQSGDWRDVSHSDSFTAGYEAAWTLLTRKHVYWGAGDPDCPREIKAANGELHTLLCKVCGGSRGFCTGGGEKNV